MDQVARPCDEPRGQGGFRRTPQNPPEIRLLDEWPNGQLQWKQKALISRDRALNHANRTSLAPRPMSALGCKSTRHVLYFCTLGLSPHAPDAPALPPKDREASRGNIESPCTLKHPGEPGDQPPGGPQSPRRAWMYPSPAPSGARSRCSSAPSQGSRGF